MNESRPFCTEPAAAAAFDRWLARLGELGLQLSEADRFVVGLLASREARLEALVAELGREKDGARRLKLVGAERLAAADMAKALDQAERVFGAAVAEPDAKPAAATGTEGRVLTFAPSLRGLSATAQRIVAVVERSPRPLTKEALRRRVAGTQGDFLAGLKEAQRAGGLQRRGGGRKGSPFVYSRGES